MYLSIDTYTLSMYILYICILILQNRKKDRIPGYHRSRSGSRSLGLADSPSEAGVNLRKAAKERESALAAEGIGGLSRV